ncbi:hypothetical protein P170DRAFT_88332 [Aspergillus steynii IBT 23096]|uniref:Uncharacterized protein n=1 Tax=Aspergillus steynii IBT 23096 TaxID=1392250 RepID=A0A2I2GFZ1_9EURO|nr:uncharacterized protein P170DRAFT_88332 [Aspergillus steynii IBT 23096]PLB51806.1 hypothetical protein P170DRAFT_88332 [Aspergillus steynii IBT 23096]
MPVYFSLLDYLQVHPFFFFFLFFFFFSCRDFPSRNSPLRWSTRFPLPLFLPPFPYSSFFLFLYHTFLFFHPFFFIKSIISLRIKNLSHSLSSVATRSYDRFASGLLVIVNSCVGLNPCPLISQHISPLSIQKGGPS